MEMFGLAEKHYSSVQGVSMEPGTFNSFPCYRLHKDALVSQPTRYVCFYFSLPSKLKNQTTKFILKLSKTKNTKKSSVLSNQNTKLCLSKWRWSGSSEQEKIKLSLTRETKSDGASVLDPRAPTLLLLLANMR